MRVRPFRGQDDRPRAALRTVPSASARSEQDTTWQGPGPLLAQSLAAMAAERRPPSDDPAELVAHVSAAKRDVLLRVHRHRLGFEDLEDCFSQATLGLISRARAFVGEAHIAKRTRAALPLAHQRSPARAQWTHPDPGRDSRCPAPARRPGRGRSGAARRYPCRSNRRRRGGALLIGTTSAACASSPTSLPPTSDSCSPAKLRSTWTANSSSGETPPVASRSASRRKGVIRASTAEPATRAKPGFSDITGGGSSARTAAARQ
jgi:hypothetical protein